MARLHRDVRRPGQRARGRPHAARVSTWATTRCWSTCPRPRSIDADVRPRRTPATLTERTHPTPRRPRQERRRRPTGFRERPSGDDGGADRRRLRDPRTGRPAPCGERSPADLRQARRRTGQRARVDLHRHQRGPARRSCVRRGAAHRAVDRRPDRREARSGSDDGRSPPGFPQLRREHRREGRHRRPRRHRRRPTGRRIAAMFTKSRFAGPSVTLSRRPRRPTALPRRSS